MAAVAQDDVAAVAATVLRSPGPHAGTTYSLTGPDAITLAEAADVLSGSIGRRFEFHNETVEEAYASRASCGAPDWQVDACVGTYTAIASGELAGVTDDVARLTGRSPMSLEDLLRRSTRG